MGDEDAAIEKLPSLPLSLMASSCSWACAASCCCCCCCCDCE
jgi:hypothetical protein